MNCNINYNIISMNTINQRLMSILIIYKKMKCYATEFKLKNVLVDWTIQFYHKLKKIYTKQTKEKNKKNKYLIFFLKTELELYKKKIAIKELLTTSNEYNNYLFEENDIIGSIPSSRKLRYNKAFKIKSTFYKNIEKLNADNLSQQTIDKLETLIDIIDNEYKKALKYKDNFKMNIKQLVKKSKFNYNLMFSNNIIRIYYEF